MAHPLGANFNYAIHPHQRSGEIGADFKSPGPAIVTLRPLVGYDEHDYTRYRSPAHSFGMRRRAEQRSNTPGPAVYHPDEFRSKTPGVTIAGKRKEYRGGKGEESPGPGHYSLVGTCNVNLKRAPEYSFGMRGNQRRGDSIPGPNAYAINMSDVGKKTMEAGKVNPPAFSLATRSRHLGREENSPSPASYYPPSSALPGSTTPAFSMSGRYLVTERDNNKAGPAAYQPERVHFTKPYSPAYSFGVKHSPYSDTFADRTEQKEQRRRNCRPMTTGRLTLTGAW